MNEFELLIATRNAGKVTEIEKLLTGLSFKLRSLNDFNAIVEPEETGTTFIENATLKAEYYAAQTGLWALADDSGLEVEALGGAPGILSARYAGAGADEAAKMKKLLTELAETSEDDRAARFVCAMAISDDKGATKQASQGICDGKIASTARGKNGFGYDPIFIPTGFSETFGELPNEIKSKISHRARALDKIISYLRSFPAL